MIVIEINRLFGRLRIQVKAYGAVITDGFSIHQS